MKQNLVAVIAGLLFGLGLSLSQMVDRSRVLGFLDVTGAWDSTFKYYYLCPGIFRFEREIQAENFDDR